ncbi:MAG: hypothetical protein E7813_07255 [Bradyrhizobium sp.]|uniref:hypothetical protein n=1 Tax=Bradyrhizobium sp. TaxID=376 RepID=UPI001226C79E|nr:hypothetical protein [Bradyrhizobium sp.]THD70802.1 MAG: hypothetical protein E7813_07255 [Bradyrhizobium sp.]
MTIFLILAPYGAFAALMLVASATVSLFTAAAICLLVIAYDMMYGRSMKILGAGSAILFASLGCYLALTDSALSVSAVKLTVDSGMLAIALASLAIRFPFTLQYARESVDAETAALPGFLRANYIITSAWSAAFLLMLMSNVMMIYVPGLPLWCGLAIAFAARNTALYFTKWYPKYRQAKFAAHSSPPGVL